jgi:hypothetical protein
MVGLRITWAAYARMQGLPAGSLSYNNLALQARPPPTQPLHLAQQIINDVFEASRQAPPSRGFRSCL